MADAFDVKLLRRALGDQRRHTSIKTLYGDRSWVDELDIVNELGGHTGCVNALSWSQSGHQLASGSDDTYLNIWDYNPSNLAKPWTLNTSVSTGHHANIFSVKFMPHSNDRTVITCAGDSQVRVFDLEYAGARPPSTAEAFQSSTRSRRFNTFFANARWRNESNTNARVYRSHADRAKRVVTESSPHLFLTCSEDGEVRQWDLRQPSSAYPPPRSSRRWGRYSTAGEDDAAGTVPPPLISYKKYALDLNSISCSGGQPQYIALGGAHLHCFLHDRRMIGRDITAETGQPVTATPEAGTNADEAMNEATRCVRRFAPNGKRKMKSHDHGHITACKISDANPNEMIASWSGDHIYSFDLVKSPDAREAEAKQEQVLAARRLRNHRERKRKRANGDASSSSLADTCKPPQRLRRVGDTVQESGRTALRIQYENGDSEVLPVARARGAEIPIPHDALLTEAQKLGERVAHALVKLRKTLFDFAASTADAAAMEASSELTPHTATFINVLGQCSTLLPQMDEVIRGWSYPVNPTDDDVVLQNTLRRNRQASWRFVQASGCLVRALGGKLQTLDPAADVRWTMFDSIKPAAREERNIGDGERFCYDFLKAIILWLTGGRELVFRGFQRPPEQGGKTQRFPLLATDEEDVQAEKLHNYLHTLAGEEIPLVDVDTNRFEHDESRNVFASQKQAVAAFVRAMNLTQLAMHGESSLSELEQAQTSSAGKRLMDKGAAARFWGVKVGRALLMQAAEGVTFDFVNRAFGGIRLLGEREEMERAHEEDNADNEEREERVVADVDLVNAEPEVEVQLSALLDTVRNPGSSLTSQESMTEASAMSPDGETPLTVHVEEASDGAAGEGTSAYDGAATAPEEEEDEEDENDASSSDDDNEEDSEDNAPAHPLFRRRVAFGRSNERASVNGHVPYSSHTRVYKGHCNARTVKDVNYYGLNDEYVVSGSDDGNFFIWDRRSGTMVNILEGDGEVVNVVQGHPYEPVIACSGIDSTVKIFGVDARERRRAEKGIDVANPGGGVHSSLRWGGRHRMRRMEYEGEEEEEEEADAPNGANANTNEEVRGEDEDDEEEGQAGKRNERGLRSRRAMQRNYEIMNQNDAARREEDRDAFLTEDVLARVAAVLQQRRAMGIPINIGGLGVLGPGEEGNEVELSENCLVM